MEILALLCETLLVISVWSFGDTHVLLDGHRNKRHTTFDSSEVCRAFGCKNGFCKEGELRNFRIVCECFTGYAGKLCDRLKCPYECGPHGTCTRKGQLMFCKCDKNYQGTRCDTYTSPMTSSKEPQGLVAKKPLMDALSVILSGQLDNYQQPNSIYPPIISQSTWLRPPSSAYRGIKFSDFHSHAEVDMSVAPDVCAPGFECFHGHCDRNLLSMGVFACVCKANYTGLFCEKRCTLSCQNNGTCLVQDDGHQLCSCPFNFTGHYCERREPTK